MLPLQLFAVIFLTLLSAFCALAQSATNATCQTITGIANINATLFEGLWYEEIRAPSINISCVQVNVTAVNGQTQLNVTATYSPTKTGTVMSKFVYATVNISEVNANTGFVVRHQDYNTTYKILSTDYNSNVILCGYTNISNPASSFGIILTRYQFVNSTRLMQLKSNASDILPGFNETTAANVMQSPSCKLNSATSSVPALATLLAALYAVLKLTY